MTNGIDNQTSARYEQNARSYSDALVYVTLACNLRCPRCFLHDLDQQRRSYMMAWEQYERILFRLKEQNVTLNLMHFTGGEPTLWKHLKPAILLAKQLGIARTVRVVTNAVDRNGADYGEADIVHVSHYGAVNRYDILRLKRQLGKRLKVQRTVHLNWPFDRPSPNNMPAECGCVNLAFLGDRVWPCGFAAARNAPGSLSVEDQFWYKLVNGDPHTQELCRTCISNRKNKVDHMAGLTFEWGIWDSPIGGLWSIKSHVMWARAFYRRFVLGRKS